MTPLWGLWPLDHSSSSSPSCRSHSLLWTSFDLNNNNSTPLNNHLFFLCLLASSVSNQQVACICLNHFSWEKLSLQVLLKDHDIIVLSTLERPIEPTNVSGLDASGNFISQTSSLELDTEPSLAKWIRLTDGTISAINRHLAYLPFVTSESGRELDL